MITGESLSETRHHLPIVWIVAATVGLLLVASLGGFGVYSLMGGGTTSAWGTKIGLSKSADGKIVVDVLTCENENVVDVQLSSSDSAFASTGILLWRIQSSVGSSANPGLWGWGGEFFWGRGVVRGLRSL